MDEEIPALLNHPKKNSKSTIKDKSVHIKGTNDFGFDAPNLDSILTSNDKKQKNKNTSKATKTARMTPETILKINLLQSFIDSSGSEKRKTINDTIESLADSYINNVLSERQRETFQQLFEMQSKN